MINTQVLQSRPLACGTRSNVAHCEQSIRSAPCMAFQPAVGRWQLRHSVQNSRRRGILVSNAQGSPTPQQKEDDEPLPPWVRAEQGRALKEEGDGLPFGLYLLAASLVAIASVGSFYEYFNKNAIFGVVQPDSFLYLPILALFAFTGLPTAGYLFYKSVDSANKLAERMDKQDARK